MAPRLAAKVEISALVRLVNARGGTAMVLARGDPEAGSILLIVAERGVPLMLLERVPDPSGVYRWQATIRQDPENKDKFNDYLARRRRNDPDLWALELDIAGAEQFAAEMMASG
jgi:hypothetical protein